MSIFLCVCVCFESPKGLTRAVPGDRSLFFWRIYKEGWMGAQRQNTFTVSSIPVNLPHTHFLLPPHPRKKHAQVNEIGICVENYATNGIYIYMY